MTTARPSPPRRARTSRGWALPSFLFGLLGFCLPVFALAGIVCGHLELSAIKQSKRVASGRGLALAGLAAGYVAALAWGAVAVLFFSVGGAAIREIREREAAADQPFSLADTPIPGFPALPEGEVLQSSGVRVAQLDLPAPSGPGTGMSLRVYLPAGKHAPRSLAGVLIAPAGSNLLGGAGLDPLDRDTYHDEALPYAEAGLAAVLYSIDGPVSDEAGIESMKEAYGAFVAAGAGTVNGRNAVAFVERRLPMVDPGRLYAAGHSSAGTLALLLAAHEPRLKGCLAYAPALDLEAHFAELTANPATAFAFPGLRAFAKRSSPLTHAGRIAVPTFLFVADDDDLVDPGTVAAFVGALGVSPAALTVRRVPEGGHYQSMIEAGIPAGIAWIRDREGGAPR